MPFATPDLCDQFGAEVRVAEPLFRDCGGRGALRGTHRHATGVRGQRARPRRRSRRRATAACWSSTAAARSGRRWWAATWRRWPHRNGWSGLVVYGCVRDAAELAATPVGVKALHAVPRRSAKDGAGERGVPVAFAGVTFAPGRLALCRRGRHRDRPAPDRELSGREQHERPVQDRTGRSIEEVVDRPLSLRRQAEVPAPPFFDLPLFRLKSRRLPDRYIGKVDATWP